MEMPVIDMKMLHLLLSYVVICFLKCFPPTVKEPLFSNQISVIAKMPLLPTF